jgi:hypothetical protein
MSAIKIIQGYARKSLTTNKGSGITTIPGAMQSEAKAGEIVALLQRAGIPMNQLDDFIRSEADVAKFLNIIEAASKPKVYSGQAAVDQLNKLFPKKGEVVQFPQKTSFKEQIEAMKKSGDIVDPNNLKKNDNVLKREMFQDSNLNKEGTIMDRITTASNRIKQIQKEQDEMYRPKTDAEIKAKFDKQNKDSVERLKKKNRDSMPIRLMKNFEKELNEADLMAEGYSKDQANVLIKARQKMTSGEEMNPNESLLRVKEEFADNAGVDVEDFTDIDFEIDIPDYAKGGRAGFYTGGITDVEPSLDDIGHGADAMNARTRLMSPGNQATTSTGLNYLLAEDNDNMRIPFSAGGGGRRAFLKLLASIGGGAAAFKSGILGLGEGGTKKAVTETVKQAAGSGGQVPPYFLKLVSKIKTLGDETVATKDKAIAKKYKDYTMEEDFAGNIEIIKKGDNVSEDVFMSLKVDDVPLKGKKGSTKVKEYEEYTATPDSEGKMKNIEQGVPDEVVNEGSVFEDNMTEFGMTKKADGGRIGFSAGKTVLSKLGINSTSRRFLEKVFGKEGFETMIENDPRMHKGMLEVVEMFRNRDKEGLKMYLQKFLPDMDDATVEDFIVGDSGTEGITGQLIRLGSGREYKSLIDLKKQADNVRKLEDFDIDGVSKNAEGGRIGLFLGGGATAGKGLAREMLKFMTKGSSNAKSPAEILKMMNPKQFEKLLDNPAMLGKISPQTGQSANEMIIEMIKKTKDDRSSMVGDLIGSARKIKKVEDSVIAYKKKIIKDMIDGGIDEDTAYAFAEKMAKEMKEAAAPQLTASPPKITEQGLLELENIQKNLLTKGRKLQATGGLTTMLGE